MAKQRSMYICSECGYESGKWYGKCPGCGEWNTMNEETPAVKSTCTKRSSGGYASRPLKRLSEITEDVERRISTGIHEFDRVLGGGIVEGSLVLLGGDPGIGKSTILLQACQHLGQHHTILYVSGEASANQIKLRANRLGVTTDSLYILAETDVGSIAETIRSEKPDIVIIDSIQTMYSPDISSAPGSVSQIRENTGALMQLAKKDNISMILVGHVTKDGSIAGPRVLEHMVDAVLYFEGEKYHTYRILRGVKNRFGSTNEIGIFEMTESGLQPVANPSEMMLDSRPENTCGSVVVPCMEGTRPLLIELQGLVSSSNFGNPRRMATGMDNNRMVLLMAIMEKRLGIQMQSVDAYINVVGGIKVDEPALDLAVIAVLYSSLRDFQIPADLIILGEVGLTGEVRNVQHMEKRLIEAGKLGFKRCIIPKGNQKGLHITGIETYPVDNIRSALDWLV